MFNKWGFGDLVHYSVGARFRRWSSTPNRTKRGFWFRLFLPHDRWGDFCMLIFSTLSLFIWRGRRAPNYDSFRSFCARFFNAEISRFLAPSLTFCLWGVSDRSSQLESYPRYMLIPIGDCINYLFHVTHDFYFKYMLSTRVSRPAKNRAEKPAFSRFLKKSKAGFFSSVGRFFFVFLIIKIFKFLYRNGICTSSEFKLLNCYNSFKTFLGMKS